MSYARFSSDDFRSDVYAYESVYGGISIHVAGNRVRGWIPRTFHIPIQWVIESHHSKLKDLRYRMAVRLYVLTYRIQSWYLSVAPRKFYSGAYAGETVYCDSHEEAIDALKMLKRLGYRVPQHAIDRIHEDELESKKEVP